MGLWNQQQRVTRIRRVDGKFPDDGSVLPEIPYPVSVKSPQSIENHEGGGNNNVGESGRSARDLPAGRRLSWVVRYHSMFPYLLVLSNEDSPEIVASLSALPIAAGPVLDK